MADPAGLPWWRRALEAALAVAVRQDSGQAARRGESAPVSPEPAAPLPESPLAPATPLRPGRKTLAGVVGIAVASALFVSIPADESGRTVEVTIDAPTGQPTVRHVRGPQYLRAYLDMVGVATACDGITRDVRIGQTYTEAECTALLERELIIHAEGVMACTPGLALTRGPRIDGPRFAAVSLAYNVGVGAFCRSTARRRFNEGRYREGCDALLMWNKAGGRVVRGLVLRRQREREVCLRWLR